MPGLAGTALVSLLLFSCLADVVLVVCTHADDAHGHLAFELLDHRTDRAEACGTALSSDGPEALAACSAVCHHEACHDSSLITPVIPASRLAQPNAQHQMPISSSSSWPKTLKPSLAIDCGTTLRPRAPPEHGAAIRQFCTLRLLI